MDSNTSEFVDDGSRKIMELAFLESFDAFGSDINNFKLKYSNIAGGALSSSGRFPGTFALDQKNLFSDISTFGVPTSSRLVIGFAMQVVESFNSLNILNVLDQNITHFQLFCQKTGHLVIRKGFSNIGKTTKPVFSMNRWIYYVLDITFNNTTGIIKVYVDGNLVIDLQNIDTTETGNNFATQFNFSDSGTDRFIDDLYVLHGSTGVLNPVFDLRISSIFPNSAGAFTEWTPLTGNNFQNVQNNPPDFDTTYNFTNTPGARDFYNIQDIAEDNNPVFHGMQLNSFIRKTDAFTYLLTMSSRTNTNNNTSASFGPTTSYQYFVFPVVTNPTTSLKYTISELNTSQIGVTLL